MRCLPETVSHLPICCQSCSYSLKIDLLYLYLPLLASPFFCFFFSRFTSICNPWATIDAIHYITIMKQSKFFSIYMPTTPGNYLPTTPGSFLSADYPRPHGKYLRLPHHPGFYLPYTPPNSRLPRRCNLTPDYPSTTP